MITLPIESLTSNAFRLIKKIKEASIKVGIAINPITPVESLNYVLDVVDKISVLTFDPGVAGQQLVEVTLSKILKLAALKKHNNYLFDIEADGSCNEMNFAKLNKAGITQCVVGTSGLFSLDNDISIGWGKMKNYMDYESICGER
jgi:D-allulose-6-phosphate 3-epimerase